MCATVEQCAELGKFVYKDQQSITHCVSSCQETPLKFHKAGTHTCVEKCADTDYKYWIRGQYVCYHECKDSKTHTFYRETDKYCYKECEAPTPFHEPDSLLCIKSCAETNLKFFDTGTSVCRQNCSSSKPYYTLIKECFRKCPFSYYKNPDALACDPAEGPRTEI